MGSISISTPNSYKGYNDGDFALFVKEKQGLQDYVDELKTKIVQMQAFYEARGFPSD